MENLAILILTLFSTNLENQLQCTAKFVSKISMVVQLFTYIEDNVTGCCYFAIMYTVRKIMCRLDYSKNPPPRD